MPLTSRTLFILSELNGPARKGGIAAFGSEHGTVVYSEPFSDKIFRRTSIVEGTNSVISAEDISVIYAEVPTRIIPIPNTKPPKNAKYRPNYVYDIHTHDIFWKRRVVDDKFDALQPGASDTDIDNYPLTNTRPNIVLSYDFNFSYDVEASTTQETKDGFKLKSDFFQEMRKKVYYYDNRSNIGDGVSFSILVSLATKAYNCNN